MRSVRIASRGSKLAMTQSNYIGELIRGVCPDAEISIVQISTKGDRDKSDFLYKTESVGFFTSEVEKALLDGRADVAVHSLKDLPTAITEGLVIAAVPERENVADVLVSRGAAGTIAELAEGAKVGTSSLRRIAQMKHARSDLNCVPLRGNVETRVRKVEAGEIDAAVMAYAGLNRLGMAEKISGVLAPADFVPAPGQGALAVQVRGDDEQLVEIVGRLNDEYSRITAEAERHVLSIMQGGCSIPLGVCARIKGEMIEIDAMLSDVEGTNMIRRSCSDSVGQSISCAEKVADELIKAGAREILDQIRENGDNR